MPGGAGREGAASSEAGDSGKRVDVGGRVSMKSVSYLNCRKKLFKRVLRDGDLML